MRLRLPTISLIVIYGAAILSFSMWEAGHTVLHAFKNSIHHHTHSHHHEANDHHALLTADDSNADNVSTVSSINCYFLFFEVCVLTLKDLNLGRQQFSRPETKLLSVIDFFFVPPPNV